MKYHYKFHTMDQFDVDCLPNRFLEISLLFTFTLFACRNLGNVLAMLYSHLDVFNKIYHFGQPSGNVRN